MSNLSVPEQVEIITCVENAAPFLAEAAAYQNCKGKEGGILGITPNQYAAVVAAGGGYEVELACGDLAVLKMADYAEYEALRCDDFASCLFAVAYLEVFQVSIPSVKEGRYELFKLLFDPNADLKTYLALIV